MLKFYATTVSLIKLIFYIDKRYTNADMKILQYFRLQINRSSHQRCSVKKGFLEILQNSQETPAPEPLF